jgi:hypothetical protein
MWMKVVNPNNKVVNPSYKGFFMGQTLCIEQSTTVTEIYRHWLLLDLSCG